MRVCYFGTYRANYSRNQIMIEGLRRNGVEVVECHQRLWRGIEDRVQVASGGWRRLEFPFRLLRTYGRLLAAYRHIGEYDVMVLGYPGQLDVPLARLLTRLRRKPLVLDVFMSVYLIAEERRLTQRHRLTACLIYEVEKLACRLPDRLIMDTAEYVHWFHEKYGLEASRFRLVPTGADDRVFRPIAVQRRDDRFRVVYYGTFIPNHGVEQIIEAANLLRGEADIHFELIGEGPTKALAVSLAEEYGLENVTFVGWLPKSELPERVAAADVCLGRFGTTPQSMVTVAYKIYEGLAMAKPVVTGDSPAVRQALTHGENVYLCRRADPQSLARALRNLRDDPEGRQRIAENGYRLYQEEFSLSRNGARFAQHLESLLAQWSCH